jgi:UV radiation resistance-associated gene protein
VQNFNFQLFDLNEKGPGVTRSFIVTIKIWTKRQESWSLLLEEVVDLRALNFIGTLLHQAFPANALIFHLVDGIYSLDISSPPPQPKLGPSLPTSSYNALMKLSTLDNSIQDAIATQKRIEAQINEILADIAVDKSPQARERVALAQKYVTQQRRALGAAEKRRTELRESLKARRKAIQAGRASQERAAADVKNAREKLDESRQMLAQTREHIHGQRRRICSDLIDIFDISPTTMGTLSFQICGLSLPNTDHDIERFAHRTDEDALSAALGFVALLTDSLQYYLSVPLTYPLTPLGSRSWVKDEISRFSDANSQKLGGQRDYPLYLPRGGSTAAEFRFKYAWFCLNKNIEALCASQGLKVVDIRDTLPNLKYLLYVCSAGRDEVPDRKRGGVRGLWAGRLKGRGSLAPTAADTGTGGGIGGDDASSVGGSRRGSAESELLSRQREELRRSILDGDDGLSAPDGNPLSSIGLPFDEEEVKLTLRTKGLRENVGR